MNHRPEGEAFLRLNHGYAAHRVHSARADKHFVQVDVAQEVDRTLADQRKRSRPLYESAGYERQQPRAIAQLHRDIDGIGDYSEVAAIADVASDLGGGSTGGESDGVMFL